MQPNTFSQAQIAKVAREKISVCKVRRVGELNYRVKGRYRLTVVIPSDGIPVVTSCVNETTGETCKGFFYTHGGCVHALKVAFHILKRRRVSQ